MYRIIRYRGFPIPPVAKGVLRAQRWFFDRNARYPTELFGPPNYYYRLPQCSSTFWSSAIFYLSAYCVFVISVPKSQNNLWIIWKNTTFSLYNFKYSYSSISSLSFSELNIELTKTKKESPANLIKRIFMWTLGKYGIVFEENIIYFHKDYVWEFPKDNQNFHWYWCIN